ncbi:MAG: molybdenum ABC transporter ATP-binding protein [Woeseiaceae bacterium]|nr:molybdenum ABC transporter ATP-binding protein [Woeseiaceae bacterium]
MHRDAFSMDMDATLPARGITGIFGRSGAGKTMLLRCIAGLEKANEARFVIDNETWADTEERVRLPAHRRNIGYVFQEPRLFPHLNVRRNLLYGRKRTKARHDVSFDQVVEVLGLSSLLARRTDKLSGGEAQRVAIGRALLRSPRLMLMDEPVAALDAARKSEVLPFVASVQQHFGIPILYVSHNIDEISQICDQLMIIDGGCVAASGTLQDVLLRTDIPVLADEEAGAVIFGSARSYDEKYGLTTVITTAGPMWIAGQYEPESKLRLRLRANDVSLCLVTPADTSILNTLPAKVVRIQEEANVTVLVHVQAGEERIVARITRRSADELKLEAGSDVVAQIKSVLVRSA